MLRMAEDERDHYKRECEILRSISRSRPNSRTSSPTRVGSPNKVFLTSRQEMHHDWLT